MAISVDKTLKQLETLASDLQLNITASGKNGRFMKEDYILPIRNYNLIQQYKSLNNVPDHLKLVMQLKSPMLAKRIDALKPQLQKEIWESDKWYFEEKLNGCRLLLVKTSEGLFLYSRHNSDVDLLPINYTDHIVLPDMFDLSKINVNFILDVEITSEKSNLNTTIGGYGVITETPLQAITAILNCHVARATQIQKTEGILFTFNVFDCLYYEGHWLLNIPLKKRRSVAFEMWNKLASAGFKIRPVRSNISNKKQFYKNLILSGGEGVVAKSVNGVYIADNNRPNNGWIKIKRTMSEMLSMEDAVGDTFDGWISGFEAGTADRGLKDFVGTIKISTYVRKNDGSIYEHEIAHISGFDMKLRNDMTEIVQGIPTLKASYYGRIVEIDGQSISSRARRLNNAILIGFRYDKRKDSCVIDEDFLDNNII